MNNEFHLLKRLAEDWGMSVDDLLENFSFESMVPGVCTECGYTEEVEPDQYEGYCSNCMCKTIKSCLVLGGVI